MRHTEEEKMNKISKRGWQSHISVLYYMGDYGRPSQNAGMAELADARDLKSRDTWVSYRFDPGFRHHIAEWSSLVARRAHNPKVVGSNPASATKKDSIVDTISAMEFCFLYGKRPIFAINPLISVVFRAFFLIKSINPPFSAPLRQKWRILYRSRVQSFIHF